MKEARLVSNLRSPFRFLFAPSRVMAYAYSDGMGLGSVWPTVSNGALRFVALSSLLPLFLFPPLRLDADSRLSTLFPALLLEPTVPPDRPTSPLSPSTTKPLSHPPYTHQQTRPAPVPRRILFTTFPSSSANPNPH